MATDEMDSVPCRKEAPGIIAFRYDWDEPFKEMQVSCN